MPDLRETLLKLKNDKVLFAEAALRYEGEPMKLEDHMKGPLWSSSDYKFLDWGRRMIKTGTMIIDILHTMTFSPSSYSIYIAPSQEQAKEFKYRLYDIAAQSPATTPLIARDNSLELFFTLQGKPYSRFKAQTSGIRAKTIRGKGITHLYVDEVRDVPKEALSAILPAVRGQTIKSKIMFSSTREGDDPEIDLVTLLMQTPGIEVFHQKTCEAEIQKDGTAKISKIYTDRISDEELQLDLKIMGPSRWLCEYCCVPMSEAGNLYPPDLINAAVTAEPSLRDNALVVCGADFGVVDNNSVCVFIAVNNQKYRLLHVEVFPPGTDLNHVIDYIIAAKARYPQMIAVYPDQSGIGEKVVRDLKTAAGNLVSVRGNRNNLGIKFTHDEKISVTMGILNDFQKGDISLYYHDRLIRELKAFNIDDMKKAAAGSPDVFDAFSYAMYGSWRYSGKILQRRERTPIRDKREIIRKLKEQYGG